MPRIELLIARLVPTAKQDMPVSREVMPRDEAIDYFRNMGEEYKAEIISDIPKGEQISL